MAYTGKVPSAPANKTKLRAGASPDDCVPKVARWLWEICGNQCCLVVLSGDKRNSVPVAVV